MTYFKLPRIRVQLFGYIFSPRWLPTAAALLLLPILLSLGFWQLHRATEKKLLEKEFSTRTAPILITRMNAPENKGLQYRQILAKGYFDNRHIIYLDNKTHQQRVGYHVLTPLILANGKVVLVNRGFLPARDRYTLPVIKPTFGEQLVTGLIYFPSKTFMLKPEMLTTKWPQVLQAVNIKQLETKLNQPIFPFYILQQNQDGTDLVRDWKPVSFPSYRHTGYAIQWFALAVTLMIIYITLNTSRR